MIQINNNQKYIEFINKTLSLKRKKNNLLVCDLFAGAGGLSLGFEANGFETVAFENKDYASNTYNKNLKGKCHTQKLDAQTIYPKCDVLIGGPPCQPFSVSGHQNGKSDKRDGFPIYLNALKQIKPKVFLIENVRGTLFKNKNYLNYIIRELENCGYKVNIKILNSNNFGVAQLRERLFILGSKNEIKIPLKINNSSINSGIAIKDIINKYKVSHKFLTSNMDKYILRYEKKSKCINPRDLNLNKPARTLTCRNLGGQTSDMMRIKTGTKRRMLTVQEASRLQSFPDFFNFTGTDYQKMEQIGNAVPPLVAFMFADIIKNYILKTKMYFEGSYEFSSQTELDLFKKVI